MYDMTKARVGRTFVGELLGGVDLLLLHLGSKPLDVKIFTDTIGRNGERYQVKARGHHEGPESNEVIKHSSLLGLFYYTRCTKYETKTKARVGRTFVGELLGWR